jgi:enoyl-CoA hydratase/carnithine racemase
MSLESKEFETLLYEKRDHVIVVTLNRPNESNAIIPKMRQELKEVWLDFKADDDLYVSVLTGSGDAFCIGGDADPGHRGEGRRNKLQNRDEGFRMNTPKHNFCWKPYILAVNGECASGALHFVVDSDICIASDNATFWDTHAGREGVVVFECIQLARRIPYESALRMMLMDRFERLNAQRAYELGLVSEVVPKAKLRDRAIEIAETVAKNDIYSLIGTIEALWKGQDLGMTQALHQGLMLRQLQAYNSQLDQVLTEKQPVSADGS